MGSSPSILNTPVDVASADQPQQHLRIHAINVFVSDQDQSLRFYLDQLGFSLVGDVRFGSGERWVAVAPPDGSAVLSLVCPKQESREYELVGRSTQITFVTEDVVAKYREWRKRGVRFQHVPRLKRMHYDRQIPAGVLGDLSANSSNSAPVWGGVITHFKDPDGNSFALVSYDEESRAVEAQRREAAAKIEAERRTAQELEIAKQVQTRLFPQTRPQLSTLDFSGICIQAREVGGDYYDFLDLGRERLGLVVCDISGKGIAAALLMANLQANLRAQCATASDQPQQFLQRLNRVFFENSTDSSYSTLFFAEYDNSTRRLRYANCGHLPAVLLRRDGALDRLESTCTVLGMFADWECAISEVQLLPADMLILYTDGLTESCDEAGEEFGECRLIDCLVRQSGKPADSVIASLIHDVKQFSSQDQTDDRTVIVAKCK